MLDMPKGLQQFRIRMDAQDALRMTCVNANCENERQGWVTPLDPEDERHRGGMAFIEQDSGRRYIRFLAQDAEDYIDRYGAGWGVNLVHLRAIVGRALPRVMIYVFPPGQQCFAFHRDREVIFTHANRARVMTHSPLGYNEHWNEEGYWINEWRKRG